MECLTDIPERGAIRPLVPAGTVIAIPVATNYLLRGAIMVSSELCRSYHADPDVILFGS